MQPQVSREPPRLKVGKGRWDPGVSAGLIVLVSGEAWEETLVCVATKVP